MEIEGKSVASKKVATYKVGESWIQSTRLPVMSVINGVGYKLQSVDYEDFAEAYYRVLLNEEVTKGKDYNLSSGAEIELGEMLFVIGERLGKKVRFVSCPFPIAYAGAWGLYLVTIGKKDYREKLRGSASRGCFPMKRSGRISGYSPRTFQIGVVEEVEEYMKFAGREGYRPLGKTGICLSSLGFGCAGAWAKSVAGKPMISDDEARALFERAYEFGIRYYDTGFNYGFAEERIGRILKESETVKREDIIISTKFGERVENNKWVNDWSPEWMSESVNISMKRMGIDHIDMLMCHGGSVKDMKPELLSAMKKMKEDGKIGAFGINTFDTDVIEWVRDTHSFDFIMLDYNILRQDREELIGQLYDDGIGVIAGAPLAQSLYSNRIFRIRKMKDAWYLARMLVSFRKQFFRGRKFRFINNVEGMTGSQIALKYVLDNPHVSSAVFGTTTMSHLEDNAGARDVQIPEDILERIKVA